MTPHPILIKLVSGIYNISNWPTMPAVFVCNGATEDEAHTLMWECMYVYQIDLVVQEIKVRSTGKIIYIHKVNYEATSNI